jgi:hypothetical protein
MGRHKRILAARCGARLGQCSGRNDPMAMAEGLRYVTFVSELAVVERFDLVCG